MDIHTRGGGGIGVEWEGGNSVNFAFEVAEKLLMSSGVSARVDVDVCIAWFC